MLQRNQVSEYLTAIRLYQRYFATFYAQLKRETWFLSDFSDKLLGEEVEVALALFASFVMDPERVQQIVRWDMAVLRESPWYNQILEEGMERGREEGREEGRGEGLEQGLQQGVLDGQRRAIVHLLRVRFDPIGPRLEAIAEQLAAIEDGERLQDLLVEATRTTSPKAFLEYLNALG